MYKLKFQTYFSSAHRLKTAYSKECNNSLHGHNWKVEIIITTGKLVNDMVIDFKKLKEIIKKLDHKNLNEILDFQTTAENISKYIHDLIKKEVNQKNKIRVKLWEANNNLVEYYEN